jgi:hypothetical protein
MNGLDIVQEALDALRKDELRPAEFCATVRGATATLALPQRFRDVLEQLLDRLEASALFTEESCSFSREDLVGNLEIWLEKARTLP